MARFMFPASLRPTAGPRGRGEVLRTAVLIAMAISLLLVCLYALKLRQELSMRTAELEAKLAEREEAVKTLEQLNKSLQAEIRTTS